MSRHPLSMGCSLLAGLPPRGRNHLCPQWVWSLNSKVQCISLSLWSLCFVGPTPDIPSSVGAGMGASCGCNWNQALAQSASSIRTLKKPGPTTTTRTSVSNPSSCFFCKAGSWNTSSLWETKFWWALYQPSVLATSNSFHFEVGQTCETTMPLVPWLHRWKCHWNIKGRIASWVWSQ